ncbi:MAG: 2-(1,2-epoxy-1,2-dihydrophenyl)acetyl-CoA isomerase PaaG [Gammaproteobacteria bacterium]|nr:2-(1,2-epoxy-1,2-dihydrophenyl)acetyl-CoA isomerase PaaG [Gammaproteobacteria bacterium]MDH3768472.1 2-(1,2-epoxy-1,2-dihydrophenyl)acetyl-CoA isomerase PaaG [Gammaproteobacteria bacterium]
MTDQSIIVSGQDGYTELTLNRPDSLNSFNAAMHEQLADAIAEVEQDENIRALLITGSGRAFCAGQDLSDRAVSDDAEPVNLGRTLSTLYNPLVRRLRSLPKPVVCAVNGVAAGAGANIALACDIVIAARSAKFIQSFCKIGLLPDSGGTWILPRLVGPARAAALAMLGLPLRAEEAESWGLIYKAVDDADLMRQARALCAHFATQPTGGLAGIKKALKESWKNDFSTQLDLERRLQQQLGSSEDYREGVTAFLEKRKPVFKGR